ncbi:speriolin isoform X2 [Tachyglossus aculeatus]|uniref:speriolin isoform X2 n=1 Tax=Tachyglossus aculeatus TaxID=9261 RepID=UPI0018F31B34|nr:speriolin isoform X2 [Tachyglossus aculeatus]
MSLLTNYEGLRQQIERLVRENEELKKLVRLIRENQELRSTLRSQGTVLTAGAGAGAGAGVGFSGLSEAAGPAPQASGRRNVEFRDKGNFLPLSAVPVSDPAAENSALTSLHLPASNRSHLSSLLATGTDPGQARLAPSGTRRDPSLGSKPSVGWDTSLEAESFNAAFLGSPVLTSTPVGASAILAPMPAPISTSLSGLPFASLDGSRPHSQPPAQGHSQSQAPAPAQSQGQLEAQLEAQHDLQGAAAPSHMADTSRKSFLEMERKMAHRRSSKFQDPSKDSKQLTWERLVGEIAFQLDRRILSSIFPERVRLYGFTVSNVPEKIIQASLNPVTRKLDEEQCQLLTQRYVSVMNRLHGLGYDSKVHPALTEQLVNTYGILRERPELTASDSGAYNSMDFLKRVVLETVPPGLLTDALLLLSCLGQLSQDDGKPMFIW